LESKDEDKPTGVILSAADAGQNQRGWQLNITKGKLQFLFASAAPDNAIHLEQKKSFSWRADGITSWPRMTGRQSAGAALYIDGRRQELTVLKDSLQEAPAPVCRLSLVASIPTRILCGSCISGFPVLSAQLSQEEASGLPVEDYVASSSRNRSRPGRR